MYQLSHISFREDEFVSMEFILDEDFSSFREMDLKNFNKKLSFFYSKYIDISQKHQIGEIIPIPYLREYDIDLKETYIDLMHEFSFKNSSCCLFPRPNLYLTTSNREYTRIHPSSCKFSLLNKENVIVEDYFFIDREQVSPLHKHKYNKLPSEQAVFSLDGIGFNLSNNQFLNERQVGFTISFYSEFWFEKIIWEAKERKENNYVTSIHNAPRFNSFLRDLKSIWLNEMNGKFQLNQNWYGNMNQDGILIDNQIIYQENIDKKH